MSYTNPIIISLDGNIGVGKSTLLTHIQQRFPDILVLPEPVDTWTSLKTEDGQNLLELFYKDKKRWSYTFQNAAILSRLRILKQALATAKPGQIILTERSVLTDRHVFAEMLYEQGLLNSLEWDLYNLWYNTFALDFPIAGIIHITTSVTTAAERIHLRARSGEASIDPTYLQALEHQHDKWIASTPLPVLAIDTETGTDRELTLDSIGQYVRNLRNL